MRWAAGQDGMLITPTGMGADRPAPDDLVWLGRRRQAAGRWRRRRSGISIAPVYRAPARRWRRAAHATRCMPRRWPACAAPLPAFHYMVAVAGGDDVPLVPYATFGSEALSAGGGGGDADRDACLLAQPRPRQCRRRPGAAR